MQISNTLKNKFLKFCTIIAKKNLVTSSSGNLSLKFDDNYFIITSSGSCMESIDENQLSIVSISDGKPLDDIIPSSEVEMHLSVYRLDKNINSILHFQSAFATILACCNNEDINYNVIPEIPHYIGKIKKIKYENPGSSKLAKLISDNIFDNGLINITNHGQVTWGKEIDEVIKKAEFFELASKIIVLNNHLCKTINKEHLAYLDKI